MANPTGLPVDHQASHEYGCGMPRGYLSRFLFIRIAILLKAIAQKTTEKGTQSSIGERSSAIRFLKAAGSDSIFLSP